MSVGKTLQACRCDITYPQFINVATLSKGKSFDIDKVIKFWKCCDAFIIKHRSDGTTPSMHGALSSIWCYRVPGHTPMPSC